MLRHLARLLVLVPLVLAAITAIAAAHDSWISRNQLKNAAGEWCCGEGDCFTVSPHSINVTSQGYSLSGVETVPFAETQPSPDGAFWRCKRPDGSRRCFFAPPPGS